MSVAGNLLSVGGDIGGEVVMKGGYGRGEGEADSSAVLPIKRHPDRSVRGLRPACWLGQEA